MTAAQLRNSILQEAICGRLVPQDPNDEPATNLLMKTATFRKNALQNKLIRKPDAIWEPITDDEKFMELPIGWTWARLGELGMYRKGPFGSSLTKAMFVPKSDTSYKVYEQKNAIQKDYRLGEYYISKAKFDSMQSFIVNSGDIIVSCAGTIGETYVIPEGAPIGIINQALMRVKLYDNNLVDYWLLFFEYIVMTNTELKGNGSAIKNIPPFDILKNLAIPIPPLAEQQRIISKFKELLPIVEQYGKAQTELDELNAALPVRLRQSILQEALYGRLVEQKSEEESVDALLSEIANEKNRLLSLNEIKRKDIEIIPVGDEEQEYQIPNSWKFVRLRDVCTCIFSGKSPKYSVSPTAHKIIGQQCNQWAGVDMKYVKYGTDEYASSIPTIQYLRDHDVLLNTLGNGTLGRSGIFYQSLSNSPILTDGHIFVMRTLYEATAKYILAYLRTKYVDINRSADGSTNQTFLNLSKVSNWVIPLPPLEEQKRIVARIEELFDSIKF